MTAWKAAGTGATLDCSTGRSLHRGEVLPYHAPVCFRRKYAEPLRSMDDAVPRFRALTDIDDIADAKQKLDSIYKDILDEKIKFLTLCFIIIFNNVKVDATLF